MKIFIWTIFLLFIFIFFLSVFFFFLVRLSLYFRNDRTFIGIDSEMSQKREWRNTFPMPKTIWKLYVCVRVAACLAQIFSLILFLFALLFVFVFFSSRFFIYVFFIMVCEPYHKSCTQNRTQRTHENRRRRRLKGPKDRFVLWCKCDEQKHRKRNGKKKIWTRTSSNEVKRNTLQSQHKHKSMDWNRETEREKEKRMVGFIGTGNKTVRSFSVFPFLLSAEHQYEFRQSRRCRRREPILTVSSFNRSNIFIPNDRVGGDEFSLAVLDCRSTPKW